MIEQGAANEYLVLLNAHDQVGANAVRARLRHILPPDNFVVMETPADCAFNKGRHDRIAVAERIRLNLIDDLGVDAVHVTSLFEGYSDEVVVSVGEGTSQVATAVTLYDLIPLRQSGTYLSDQSIRQHYMGKVAQLKRADLLLAISEYSAEEGRSCLKGYSGRIVNVRGGVDRKFSRAVDCNGAADAFLNSSGVTGRFIMYTASFDARKNHRRLIEAFGSVSPQARSGVKLVIVGNGWDEVYRQLHEVARNSGLAKSDVIFAGRVGDDVLIDLYQRCSLFVFPSLWEGLGLPVIEAMSCGAPVVASRSTSLVEIVREEDAMFDPTNVREMSGRIARALTDSSFHSELKKRSVEISRDFTWENSALVANASVQEMVKARASAGHKTPVGEGFDTVREIVLGGGVSDDVLQSAASALAGNWVEKSSKSAKVEARLGWVSSWGTRCGIASYSANLVEAIQGDVVIFAPRADDTADFGAKVVRCWTQGKADDLSDLLAAIEDQQRECVVVQFNYGFYCFQALNALVRTLIDRNIGVVLVLHSTIDPPPEIIKDRLRDLAPALSFADAVFVHSEGDVKRLGDLGISVNVMLVPQGVPASFQLSSTAASKRSEASVIASYGFFLPHKGLLELIEAVGLLRGRGREVKLKMVNANYGDTGGVSSALISSAKDRVRSLGLDEYVEFHSEYLSDRESQALLVSADVIVYPYQATGESSSAAVRMGLSVGRPILVTPLAIFDDVAACTFQAPGTDPNSIAVGIERTLDAIVSRSSDVVDIMGRAERIARAYDVRNVAKFTQRFVDRVVGGTYWKVVAEPVLATLPLGEAVLAQGVLRGAAGGELICHGPYLTLDPGAYKLVVEGVWGGDEGEEVCGSVSITKNGGAELIVSSPIVSGAVLSETLFSVSASAGGVEIVVRKRPPCFMAIKRYRLYRRGRGQ